MVDLTQKLAICSVCRSVRVSDRNGVWISESQFPELYRELVTEAGDKLSHGYCPICYQQARTEAGLR